jgi:hypothetical protein
MEDYQKLKDNFILGFMEGDDLRLFFAFQTMMQLVKSGDLAPNEVQELVQLIGGQFTIWGTKYELQ